MAINTPEKRRSAAGVGFWVVGPSVTPNAAKDGEWRAEAAWGYSGVFPAPGAGGTGDALRLGECPVAPPTLGNMWG